MKNASRARDLHDNMYAECGEEIALCTLSVSYFSRSLALPDILLLSSVIPFFP